MPTKQFLMDNYDSAAEILSYAVSTHGTSNKLVYVKHTGNMVFIKCSESANPANEYEGTGSSKKEALADCISLKFPA